MDGSALGGDILSLHLSCLAPMPVIPQAFKTSKNYKASRLVAKSYKLRATRLPRGLSFVCASPKPSLQGRGTCSRALGRQPSSASAKGLFKPVVGLSNYMRRAVAANSPAQEKTLPQLRLGSINTGTRTAATANSSFGSHKSSPTHIARVFWRALNNLPHSIFKKNNNKLYKAGTANCFRRQARPFTPDTA